MCSLGLHTCPAGICTELKRGPELGARKGKNLLLFLHNLLATLQTVIPLKKKKSAGKEIYEWTTGEGKGQKLLALTLLMIKLASNHSPTLSLSHLHFLMGRKG